MDAQKCRKILQDETEPLLLLDVREAEEVSADPYFHTPTASYAHIPLSLLGAFSKEEVRSRLEAAASGLGRPFSDITLVVACRSGGRSRVAQEYLADLGIKSENLEGGRVAWGDAL